jgi:RNA polymerase sigma factor (sigma-70 family)
MATPPLSNVLRHVRRAALAFDRAERTDGQLLDRFVRLREEAAFAALVRRHGPMVLGVCRRVLGNAHDAEDAFQATFLVLARRAASVARPDLLGNWLYGVAHRTALEARAVVGRRGRRERQVPEMPEQAAREGHTDRDWRPLLDEELAELPDRYREAVVLCHLEGLSRRQAARRLGIPEGTLSSRLATALRRLAGRLARRGVVLSAAALVGLGRGEAAGVPAALAGRTVQAATLVAVGRAVSAGAIPGPVAALTERVMKAMLFAKLKTMAAWLVAVPLVGAALWLCRGGETLGAPAAVENRPTAAAPAGQEPAPKAGKAGRIYYHERFTLKGVEPDGSKAEDVTDVRDLGQYQAHLARLSADAKWLAYGSAVEDNNGVRPPDSIYLRDLSREAMDVQLVHLAGAELHH